MILLQDGQKLCQRPLCQFAKIIGDDNRDGQSQQSKSDLVDGQSVWTNPLI